MLTTFQNEVRPMEYPVLAGGQPPLIDIESPVDLADRVRELEVKLGEQTKQFAQKLESVRNEALERGRQMAISEHAAWRQQCVSELRTAIDEFCARRDEYLARVEHEVVRLALAVAERIIHRESQVDPLLLSGAVRVALGHLAESTQVRLRVPAMHQEMWADLVRLMPELPLRPEVIADEGLQTCEAGLETKVGTVDLGIRAQLREVERGFFDPLDARKETIEETSGLTAREKR
ncbi:MAG: FliH/SctL family protein [Acidobacteriaceae bacterium]